MVVYRGWGKIGTGTFLEILYILTGVDNIGVYFCQNWANCTSEIMYILLYINHNSFLKMRQKAITDVAQVLGSKWVRWASFYPRYQGKYQRLLGLWQKNADTDLKKLPLANMGQFEHQ